MSKRKEAVLFTVWGVTIFSLAIILRSGIAEMLAKILYRMLPVRVWEHLGASWMGGDWVFPCIGAVLGAVLGFATWFVYRSIVRTPVVNSRGAAQL
jgi:hypothetical protein